MALKNKLGIQNSLELAMAEERISKRKALEMFENNMLCEFSSGSYDTLCKIHFQLFSDIYEFAGKTRSVNISKGGFRFAPALYLSEALEQIERMPQNTFDEIIEKYVEMNIAHPFREGNGRSTRIWLDHILSTELGVVIDWSKIDKEEYLLAMERSPVKDTELKRIIENALTNRIDDRKLFMKGIDHSYAYEGYEAYITSDLDDSTSIIYPEQGRK